MRDRSDQVTACHPALGGMLDDTDSISQPAQRFEETDFNERVHRLHAAGFALLPARGKVPAMKYRGLRRRLSPKAVIDIANRNGATNLVFIPGLTCVKQRDATYSLCIIDADDAGAVDWAFATMGSTPGVVRTRRGAHLYYRVPHWVHIPSTLTSLRGKGLAVDIKHGRKGAIVVAPGSRHPDDQTFIYTFDSCDERVLRHLPLFPVHVLEHITDTPMVPWRQAGLQSSRPRGGHNGAKLAAPPPVSVWGEVVQEHNGSRKLGLNRHLCGRHGKVRFAAEAEVVAEALRLNASFAATSKGPLPINEAEAVGRDVWAAILAGRVGAYAGKRIETTVPAPTGERVVVSGNEIDLFRMAWPDRFYGPISCSLSCEPNTSLVPRAGRRSPSRQAPW
ncbi:MAG: bifunctional DNA primase/polymerase [Hyphomicrobiaceae bacterium]